MQPAGRPGFPPPPAAALPAAVSPVERSSSPRRGASVLSHPGMPHPAHPPLPVPGVPPYPDPMLAPGVSTRHAAALRAQDCHTLHAACAAAAAETLRLRESLGVAERRADEESAACAFALREGREALRAEREAAQSRIAELSKQLGEAQKALADERAAHKKRADALEKERQDAVSKERKAGTEQINKLAQETHGALAALQEQLQEVAAEAEAGRQATREENEATVAAQRELSDARDRLESLRQTHERQRNQWLLREAALRREVNEAADAAEQAAGEADASRAAARELESRNAALAEQLRGEERALQEAQQRRQRAEAAAQRAAAAASEAELRAVETARRAEAERHRAAAARRNLMGEVSRRGAAEEFSHFESQRRHLAEEQAAETLQDAIAHRRASEDQRARAAALAKRLQLSETAREASRRLQQETLARECEKVWQQSTEAAAVLRVERERSERLGRELAAASPQRSGAASPFPQYSSGGLGMIRAGSLS
eukprot:TRINITY_DN13609_c4_g1_i1.p1 TRINITY_DN13609_c4_g1~~TRINITY_DN13609_c4_g1_i1.p1  ORF type:complete len:514 (+),score=207.29 TRINITY_DN13609_c4_g1_i1:71-1543(+)